MSPGHFDTVILIDADVVSHFISAGEAHSIHLIFPSAAIHLLDKVHNELLQWPNPKLRSIVQDLLNNKQLILMPFPEDDDVIRKEYAWIKTKLFKGDGESACLAVARYNKHIIASSNLKDIKHYCDMHKVQYLTTMDFLCEALRIGLFDIDRCNHFLQTVRLAGGKLPVAVMGDFVCRELRG
jgi:hypothetical protein